MVKIKEKGVLTDMNNDLSQMVKSGPTEDPIVFTETDLKAETPTSDPDAILQDDPSNLEITSLASWFDGNIANFPNIRKPTISIAGVDQAEQLLVTVGVPSEDDTEKRRIVVFDDAHLRPVLDLPAMDMQLYNNGFRIVYDLGNGLFVKSYGVRTGLISVFCNDVDDLLIPHSIVRAKKRETSICIAVGDPARTRQKMAEALDVEALQLRYKQSSKAEGLESNQDAIEWLLDRQSTIGDINHHLQIDNVIIDTLA